MNQKEIPKEYKKRINKVVHFISRNLKEDLSLEKLAAVANYSPFHFQKIFKQVIGESPKQYIIRMRLENASHSIIIYRNKSITEIALDSGFSSSSTFARAFKNYFGLTADELKSLSPKNKITKHMYINSKKHITNVESDFINSTYDVKYWTKKIKVTVSRISSSNLIFINAPLSDTLKIQEGFLKIIQKAEIHDLFTEKVKFIGIIYPHQVLYSAAITISSINKLSDDLNETVINAGKYATFKIKGNTLQTFHGIHAFYELWLPNSGYQIASPPFCFEVLSESPLKVPYNKIEREIYISIEPT